MDPKGLADQEYSKLIRNELQLMLGYSTLNRLYRTLMRQYRQCIRLMKVTREFRYSQRLVYRSKPKHYLIRQRTLAPAEQRHRCLTGHQIHPRHLSSLLERLLRHQLAVESYALECLGSTQVRVQYLNR